MSDLLAHLASWRPFGAVVVGDFMLDEMVFGAAERMSPDAPAPVLVVDRTERAPGGAANVCRDLVAMRASVRAIGVVGSDAAGSMLRDDLVGAGVDAEGLVADDARPTTVKRSLIGLAQHRHPQKMFRMDVESDRPIDVDVQNQLLAELTVALPGAEVVCIEDYGKGVCTPALCQEVIARCRRAHVPVLVDPARLEDYSRYAGATCLTPNRSEAELAARSLGLSRGASPTALARAMQASLDLDAVALTLDRDGALLVERDGEPASFETVVREVYDVTGAGDMVLAALAGAVANKMGWPDAVRLANAAAGLEVEVFGVEPIPIERIHHAVLLEEGALRGKRRTLDELLIEVASHRRQGRKIIFTNGCFDIIHAGHIVLLRQAARLGDMLIVAVNSDDSIRRLKGAGRPVNHEEDRLDVLSELESVDAVIVFGQDTPIELIRSIRPDVLVKGADYEKSGVVGADLVESWGGRVQLVPLLSGRSTSATVQRLGAP